MDDLPARTRRRPPPAKTAKRARHCVYEAVNDETLEIYLGMTPGPLAEVLVVLRAAPPPALRAWDFAAVTVRGVEFDLDRESARQFLEVYATTLLPRGWRFLR